MKSREESVRLDSMNSTRLLLSLLLLPRGGGALLARTARAHEVGPGGLGYVARLGARRGWRRWGVGRDLAVWFYVGSGRRGS